MLILTRRVGETIIIGDNVVITVLSMKGNQVRIGITAPKDVTVHREEIYQRIQQEKNSTTPATVAAPITPAKSSIPAFIEEEHHPISQPASSAKKTTTIIKKKRERKEKLGE